MEKYLQFAGHFVALACFDPLPCYDCESVALAHEPNPVDSYLLKGGHLHGGDGDAGAHDLYVQLDHAGEHCSFWGAPQVEVPQLDLLLVPSK